MKTIEKTIIEKKTSHAFGKDIYLLGVDEKGTNYWLEAPKWDCGWYWGFGYVETYTNNINPSIAKDIKSHAHISGILGEQEEYNYEKGCFCKGEYVHNLIDSKKFISTTFDENESWELTELFNQFYFLKTAAENFGRGKCHTANTIAPKWEKKELANEINKVHIPAITKRILEILTPVS
ncbi:MAG: hypothetical protein JSR11_00990 [Bacteroidetes bacterium]|nr:hypothetical protein [Bacteroidota bacterium]